jgi:hypothetical protein
MVEEQKNKHPFSLDGTNKYKSKTEQNYIYYRINVKKKLFT